MLNVANISFQYSDSKETLQNINFTVNEGENLCIMGESGCGKSTLLKIVYGLLEVSKGSLHWKNNIILGPEHHLIPGMDFIKYVAQDFDLMPYTSVRENIAKFLSRFYMDEAKKRTEELLEVIEMKDFANEKVKNLSGGQQQRVAIARALAKEPELLLLDEPFSQIDNFKKNSLRRKLFAYLKRKQIACIVATHDGSDALSFSDTMLVIRNHKILALETPRNLYNNPKNKYIASLFDDCNEIIIKGKKQLLYPHQIKVVSNSSTRAIITNCYFKGTFWLLEAVLEQQKIFIKHNYFLEINTCICIQYTIVK